MYWRKDAMAGRTPIAQRKQDDVSATSSTTGAARWGGKGSTYWLDQALPALQRYDSLKETAARMAPDDEDSLLTITEILLDITAELAVIRDALQSEKAAFIQWIDGQGKGVLANLFFPEQLSNYRLSGHQTAIDEYDEPIDLVAGGVLEMLDWLEEVAPSRPFRNAEGFIVCAKGHQNHPTRSECGVCGSCLS